MGGVVAHPILRGTHAPELPGPDQATGVLSDAPAYRTGRPETSRRKTSGGSSHAASGKRRTTVLLLLLIPMPEPAKPEDHRSPGDELRSDREISPQLPDTDSARVVAGERAAGTRRWPVQATEVWGLVVWGAVVVGASIPLAILGVPFWWLIPILGVVAPFVFVALQNRVLASRGVRLCEQGERVVAGAPSTGRAYHPGYGLPGDFAHG